MGGAGEIIRAANISSAFRDWQMSWPYTFRPGSKLLINPAGKKVRLTAKETAILRYLYRAGQKPIAREALLHEVWGYNSGVSTHTLETHIYRLRQKVEQDAANPALLVTDAGGINWCPECRWRVPGTTALPCRPRSSL
jgi:DNA-binding response OmpR family regulator